jgi:protein-S-isoprenylcysteine O-methyltransferase Ste14
MVGDPEGDFENTTRLVTVGAYRYIRHPLYCSILLGGTGAFFKQPTWLGLGLFSVVVAFVYATARVEEGENIKRFGEAYQEYMERTKMFLPYLV